MILYLKELPFSSGWNLKPFHKSTSKETIILSNDGIYKIIHDKLSKYKIIPTNNPFDIKNYINNYTLVSGDFEYKKQTPPTYIPYNHAVLQTQIEKYRLHPKSPTAFVIIHYENNKKDFYFETPYSPYDSSLREDILSFLSYLK